MSLPQLTAALVAKIIIALLVAAMLVFGMRACSNNRSLKDQAKLDAGQIGAFTESAGEASNTQAEVAANAIASEELTRSNEKEIRDAKGSDAVVSDDVNAARLRALCRRKAAANDPDCRVFVTH
jgi:hypothetical protein